MTTEPKKYNAIDKLSFHWRNESSCLELDKYEIDHIYQYIRDLKDENTHLSDDVDNCEKQIKQLTNKIQELETTIREMENRQYQLWHEAQ